MKIGMLFPGYSSQFVGMGKELYDSSRVVQEYFEEASNCLGINFVKLCFASSDAELGKVTNAYPALLLVGLSTAHRILELYPDMTINCVAGYGIGEYGALCLAKGLTFPDGLYLLSKLSQFYTAMREELDAKSVVVNGLASRKLKQICEEQNTPNSCAHIAIYENKLDHIVSGHSTAVDAIVDSASDAGAGKIKEVDAIEGFHTPLLQGLAEHLKMYLTKVDFKDPQIPLIMGINGKETCLAKKAQDAIIRQIAEPFHWDTMLKQFASVDMIIIPAPAKSLVAEVREFFPHKIVVGVDTVADLQSLRAYMKPKIAEDTLIDEGTFNEALGVL